MDLTSYTLGWVGTVTIGPFVTYDLEGRVVGAKTHLSRPPVSKYNRVLCRFTVSCTGTDGGGDYRYVHYERSRISGRRDEERFQSTFRVETIGPFVDQSVRVL